MVKPGVLLIWLALPLAAVAGGCGMVPRTRVADCQQRVQALSTETAQLQDEVLSQRGQLRDLSQRAVDDARQLRTLEEANRRLEQTVMAYQDERDALAASFDQFKRQLQLQASGNRPPTAAVPPEKRDDPPGVGDLARFASFAQAHPGCRFDPKRGVWTFPAEMLFRPGSVELKPEARLLLRGFTNLMADRKAPVAPSLIEGHTENSPVRLTSLDNEPASTDDLGLERARRIRDQIADDLQLDPATIATRSDAKGLASLPDDPAPVEPLGITIHLQENDPPPAP